MHHGTPPSDYKDDVKKLFEMPIKIGIWVVLLILYLTVLVIVRRTWPEYKVWINISGLLIGIGVARLYLKKATDTTSPTHSIHSAHSSHENPSILWVLVMFVLLLFGVLGIISAGNEMWRRGIGSSSNQATLPAPVNQPVPVLRVVSVTAHPDIWSERTTIPQNVFYSWVPEDSGEFTVQLNDETPFKNNPNKFRDLGSRDGECSIRFMSNAGHRIRVKVYLTPK